jgi:hypothetical protein
MASLAVLSSDVASWMNRRDISEPFASWLRMTENDIAEALRARCMVARADQAIDAGLITLPTDWVEAESIRFKDCGHLLSLEDHWTGPLAGGPACHCAVHPSWAYRFVGTCVEFLPHPVIPTDPAWQPQIVEMAWFARPKPLRDPQDSNAVLEAHYQVYLFGCLRYGAKWERDDDTAAQADAEFKDALLAANRWKTEADYSGAPLRAVVRGF